MGDEFEIDKPLKYVIFVILFLEIVSFMFNPKIKVQMLICVLMLTIIASVSLVYDMHNGIGNSKLSEITTWKIGKFVKSLPDIIQELPASAPIGWFIGLIAAMNIFAIGIITKIEYNSTPAKKFSKKSKNKIKTVKGMFISTIVSTIMMAIISYFFFGETVIKIGIFKEPIDLSALKNENAIGLLAVYTFSASVYSLHESRMLHKLLVNDMIAD